MNSAMCNKRIGYNRVVAELFIAMLLFKCALDFSFYKILPTWYEFYGVHFNSLKYCLGWIWCIAIFSQIHHLQKKTSSFFLYLTFLLQIIPITTVYAMRDEASAYYNVLCASFLLCIWGVNRVQLPKISPVRKLWVSRYFIVFLICLIGMLLIHIFKTFGMPTLTALNIYKVYELRRSGLFVLSKYLGYLFSMVVGCIIPMLIAKNLLSKKYFCAFICILVTLYLYLHTGHKTILFSLMLSTICPVWAQRKEYYKEFSVCFCLGFVFLILCTLCKTESLFGQIYSLFVRRCMIVPANLKFKYFDYFLTYPKLGMYGTVPRAMLLHIPIYYEKVKYTFEISTIYFNLPEMNSNTGFFAEGFSRFGYIGLPLICVIFAWILKLMDEFQKRTSYALTIGMFVYPIYTLTDGQLLGEIFLGPWMIIFLILLLYKLPRNNVSISNEKAL